MKKHTFLILTMLFCTSSFSQILYSKYLDETCQWNFTGSGATSNYIYQTFQTVYFEGTENRNGYTYYKEKFLTVENFYDINDITIYLGSNYYDPIEYNLVREDASGKIWKIGYYQPDIEILSLDNATILNANVGDLVPNTPFFFFDNCEIVSINTINIADLNLKHLVGFYGVRGGLIEGIGVIRQACIGDVGGLACFKKQGETVQFIDDMDCSLFPDPQELSLNTLARNKTIIFPNPATTEVTIIANNEIINTLELFDLQGRKLQTKTVNDRSVKIDISQYEKGTYIVVLRTDRRIVKEKILKL